MAEAKFGTDVMTEYYETGALLMTTSIGACGPSRNVIIPTAQGSLLI